MDDQLRPAESRAGHTPQHDSEGITTGAEHQATPDERANAQSSQQQPKHKPTPTDWIEAAAAILLVIITGTYTNYARQQIKPLKDSADAALSSAKAAENAAKAAQDNARTAADQAAAALRSVSASERANILTERSARQSLESAKTDQRAWISLTGLIMEAEPSDGKATRVTVSISNTGRTPALRVITRTIADVVPTIPPFDPAQFHMLNPPTTIFPGATGFQFEKATPELPTGRAAFYKDKVVRVYVRGRIDYCDVFHRAHWLEFCAYHESGGPYSLFTFCELGNSIDDERREQRECTE